MASRGTQPYMGFPHITWCSASIAIANITELHNVANSWLGVGKLHLTMDNLPSHTLLVQFSSSLSEAFYPYLQCIDKLVYAKVAKFKEWNLKEYLLTNLTAYLMDRWANPFPISRYLTLKIGLTQQLSCPQILCITVTKALASIVTGLCHYSSLVHIGIFDKPVVTLLFLDDQQWLLGQHFVHRRTLMA